MIESGPVWPLTGRAGDLRTLTTALLRSEPAVVVISGEAGIGKTRLLDEAVVHVGRRGASVTWIRGHPSVVDVPFSAVAHLLPETAPTRSLGSTPATSSATWCARPAERYLPGWGVTRR
ncbi:MAG: AAA family ATPase [Acidimicrobiales bacterium]